MQRQGHQPVLQIGGQTILNKLQRRKHLCRLWIQTVKLLQVGSQPGDQLRRRRRGQPGQDDSHCQRMSLQFVGQLFPVVLGAINFESEVPNDGVAELPAFFSCQSAYGKSKTICRSQPVFAATTGDQHFRFAASQPLQQIRQKLLVRLRQCGRQPFRRTTSHDLEVVPDNQKLIFTQRPDQGP